MVVQKSKDVGFVVSETEKDIIITLPKANLKPKLSKTGKTNVVFARNFEVCPLKKIDVMISLLLLTPKDKVRFDKFEKKESEQTLDI